MQTLHERLNSLTTTERQVYELIANAKASDKVTKSYLEGKIGDSIDRELDGLIRQKCITYTNGEYDLNML